MNQLNEIKLKLEGFKKHFFYNLLFKSACFFTFLVLTSYLLLNFIEYYSYLSVTVKTTIIFLFSFVFIIALYFLVLHPLNKYFNFNKYYSNEEAAKSIGSYFPDIKDKLLNTIQLELVENQDLAYHSALRRASSFEEINFNAALEKEKNRKPLILLFFPFTILVITLLWNSNIIFSGSQRLLDFNTAYEAPSPFQISPLNSALNAYKNEDFELQVKITGKYQVENAYLNYNGFQKKLKKNKNDIFTYTFQNLKEKQNFHISVLGYNSKEYIINLLERPALQKGSIQLKYPSYTGIKNEVINNIGNITIPEGTTVDWLFHTQSTEHVSIKIDSNTFDTQKDNDIYSYSHKLHNEHSYEVIMKNENSLNKNKYQYNINIIKDQQPSIDLKALIDTTLYETIVLNGAITDDYGFSSLKLYYRSGNASYKAVNIPISKNSLNQSYYYIWSIDSILNKTNSKLEYYIEVSDNDLVNGFKRTKTTYLAVELPKLNEIQQKLENESNSLENKLKKELKKLKDRDKELNKLEEKLKSKKKLDWQDKNNLKEQVQQQKQLHEELNKLKEKFNDIKEKQDKFKNQSESIKEKSQQLQELMEELLDEETKKMMEELEKLLNQNKPKDKDIKDLLEKMNKEESNLEKELERAIELYKQLKIDLKAEDTAKKLEELAKEQESLNKETEQKNSKTDKEELLKKQKDIQEKFEDVKKDVDELNEMNKELNNNEDVEENTEKKEEDIDNELNNADQQLQKNNKKKAGESQKNASEKMKEMSQSLMDMMSSNKMEQQEEDMNTLRAILENLVTISFDQEDLMNRFRKIRSVNPQFVEHSSKQLKIKDDSKIIEDSLLALANRNFQIKSFVTDELFEMNDKIEKSLEAIKLREVNRIGLNQQLAMTSMNNLALLLSDILKQMQEQMAKNMEGKQQCNKPKNKPGGKKLSQLQQDLNQKINQLKKGGKQGKELSEQLAKLAAEQEAIREALKEEQGKNGEKGDGKLEKLMEETEKDLVNKRLLDKTLKRQEDIMTRLLQSEKAMRERDLDEKREAETAKNKDKNIPKEFEDYITEKEKQIELLKSISPSYSGYYKKQINDYFNNETN